MALKGFRELFQSHTGYICDKWEQYVGAYDAELQALRARGEPVRMLEIGVQNGGSMELWAGALPPGSQVIGIDIDPGCAALTLPANARVLIGDATDETFLQSALQSDTFDLIVDDGSHRSRDILRSFELLFPRLRAGGRYFIEDLHASYWSEFGGGFRAPDAAIEFLKSLIDALHADHLRPDAAIDPAERAMLIALNQDVARLSFIDSLVVIEKYAQAKTRPFMRTVAGSRVDDASEEWRSYLSDWSSPFIAVDATLQARREATWHEAIAELRAQVTSATSNTAGLQQQLAIAERAVQDKEMARRAADDALRAQMDALAASERRLEEQALAERVLHQSYSVLHQAYEALRQTHEELRRSHDALQESHGTLQVFRDTLQESHEELRRSHDVQLSSHDVLRQSHDVLRQAHQKTRQRMKATKRSWSWRLAWPARRLERFIKRALGR